MILRFNIIDEEFQSRCARIYCASAHVFILPFLTSWGCYDIAMVYSHAFDSSRHSFAFVFVTHSWEQKHGGLQGALSTRRWSPIVGRPNCRIALYSFCVMQILSSRESPTVLQIHACPPHCIRGQQLPSCLNYPTTLEGRWNLIGKWP